MVTRYFWILPPLLIPYLPTLRSPTRDGDTGVVESLARQTCRREAGESVEAQDAESRNPPVCFVSASVSIMSLSRGLERTP